MRRMSLKTAERQREVRKFRRALIAGVGRCEVCGNDPRRVKPGRIAWELCCHEIANGPNRQKALELAFALLVVCWRCNSEVLTDKKAWPVSRQLWVLRRSRPEDYSLEKYLAEFHPNAPHRIAQEEVDAWIAQSRLAAALK